LVSYWNQEAFVFYFTWQIRFICFIFKTALGLKTYFKKEGDVVSPVITS